MTPIGAASPDPLLRVMDDYPLAQALYVAAELGLADLLADGPREIADLAAAAGAHASSLARLVRALAALGAVAEDADGRVSLTPIGASLRTGAPGSIRDVIRFRGGEWFWRSLGELLYSVRTSAPAFDHVFGMSNFDYWARHPEAGAVHDAFFTAMARRSSPLTTSPGSGPSSMLAAAKDRSWPRSFAPRRDSAASSSTGRMSSRARRRCWRRPA